MGGEHAAVGWHPDPRGRFAWRWWDGEQWTASVSDGVTVLEDPPPRGTQQPSDGRSPRHARGSSRVWIAVATLGLLVALAVAVSVWVLGRGSAPDEQVALAAIENVRDGLARAEVECEEFWVVEQRWPEPTGVRRAYCELGDGVVLNVEAFGGTIAGEAPRPRCPWVEGEHFFVGTSFWTDDNWTTEVEEPPVQAVDEAEGALRALASSLDAEFHGCP